MEGYNPIIFDLDGTISNSKIGITRSILHALAKLGITEHNPDRLFDFIGPPLSDSFKKHYGLSDRTARIAVSFYREYYSEKGIYEANLYPGIIQLLDRLKHGNKTLLIATSKATKYSEQVARYFSIDKYFALIAGSNMDLTRIKKSEIIAYALAQVPAQPKDRTVMVGDRVDDIAGAHENGIAAIAVTYGYGSVEELQKSKPEHFADSIETLVNLLAP